MEGEGLSEVRYCEGIRGQATCMTMGQSDGLGINKKHLGTPVLQRLSNPVLKSYLPRVAIFEKLLAYPVTGLDNILESASESCSRPGQQLAIRCPLTNVYRHINSLDHIDGHVPRLVLQIHLRPLL
jgi:hypothetical protein